MNRLVQGDVGSKDRCRPACVGDGVRPRLSGGAHGTHGNSGGTALPDAQTVPGVCWPQRGAVNQ